MKCGAPNCSNDVTSGESYHVLCDICADKRRQQYAEEYRNREEK